MKEALFEMAQAVRRSVTEVPLEQRSRTIAMGADGTPTSHIDKVAEDVIIRFMEKHELPLNLLSEEAGFVDRGFADTLVADPVDGTFNASTGIPYYSISLAVGRNSLGNMTEGLVMNLVTGDVFRATKGKGAFLNDSPIMVREPDQDKLLITYIGAGAVPRVYQIASKFRRVRCLGSSALELCMVACGQADAFYVEYSDLHKSPRVVDIAAALLVLREAGGEAYEPNKEILDMALSLGVRKNMVAVSSTEVLELII